jgi:hypothetical protein
MPRLTGHFATQEKLAYLGFLEWLAKVKATG